MKNNIQYIYLTLDLSPQKLENKQSNAKALCA